MIHETPLAAQQLYHALRTGNPKMAQAARQQPLIEVLKSTDKKVGMLLAGMLVKSKGGLVLDYPTNHLIELLEQYYPALLDPGKPKQGIPAMPISLSSETSPTNTTRREKAVTPEKILFLSSNPADQHELRTEQEIRDIREGLSRPGSKQPIELITRAAVRLSDLRRALLETTASLLHFSGHGNHRGIYLEDEQGYSRLLESDALNKLLGLFSNQIHAVVLNACDSWGPAQQLAAQIPIVIAMHGTLPDKAARIFSVAFYEGLAFHGCYDFAFAYAQTTLSLEGFDGHLARMLKNEGITQAKKPGFII